MAKHKEGSSRGVRHPKKSASLKTVPPVIHTSIETYLEGDSVTAAQMVANQKLSIVSEASKSVSLVVEKVTSSPPQNLSFSKPNSTGLSIDNAHVTTLGNPAQKHSQTWCDLVNNNQKLTKKGEAFTLPNGELCVKIPNWVITKNQHKWQNFILAEFHGRAPTRGALQAIVNDIWKSKVRDITVSKFSGRSFLIKIPNASIRSRVLAQGMWDIEGQSMFVSKWELGLTPAIPILKTAPVPPQFFNKDALEYEGSHDNDASQGDLDDDDRSSLVSNDEDNDDVPHMVDRYENGTVEENPDDDALSQTTKETVDVNGFQVFASQLKSVSHIFKRHPDTALNFRPKNQHIRRAYMDELLKLIETLCQSPEKLSDDDLSTADETLVDLIDIGFQLDWLKAKLNEVSAKKKIEKNSVATLLTIEEQLQKLKKMVLDVESQLQNEKVKVLAAKTPLSFKDVVC